MPDAERNVAAPTQEAIDPDQGGASRGPGDLPCRGITGEFEMSGGHLIATACIVAVFAAFMLSLAYAERTTRQK